jgi:serine phosphatase RsbU (regulator of sigma subunit)
MDYSVGSCKVLIIEDGRLFADFLKMFLKKKGYQSLTAETGREGLKEFDRSNPDLVLVDISLPDINGLEVIKRIRKKAEFIPIIVVTGTSDINIAIEAVRSGAWDYILKPVDDLKKFDKIIQKALDKSYYQKKEQYYRERLKRHSLAAKEMQESLFPQEREEWNGYVLGRHIIPSIDTSGDFIDYFLIDSEHFGFYIADVAGHGVAAAFLTIILKGFFNLYREKYNQMQDNTVLNPSKILELLNKELLQENYRRHITLFYGVINMTENRITFSNAGLYPLPIIFDGEKSCFIEQKGLPLGFVQQTDYESVTQELPSVFSLLFFSDGVLEIYQTEDPEEQKSQLLSYIDSLRDDEKAILDKINRIIVKHYSREIPDDISFLLIRKPEA